MEKSFKNLTNNEFRTKGIHPFNSSLPFALNKKTNLYNNVAYQNNIY